MGPAEPVRPAHSALGSAALGAGKTAAPAKRVAPATRVASPPGISRSVGNKNSSEKSCSVAQAGVQWHNPGSPQPSPGSSNFPALSSGVAGITGSCHHTQIIFVYFSRDGVSPCWPDWSRTPDIWQSAHLSLPKCWDYRRSSNSPASASPLGGTTGTGLANFLFLVEMGFHRVGQAGLELLASSDPPTSAPESAGSTGKLPDQEIPGRGATRVARATLLAGTALLLAVLPALPGAENTGWTGSAGPIPTRKTAIGSADD
ncbi:Protein GVQW1 [Plecturocebus cupreus]